VASSLNFLTDYTGGLQSAEGVIFLLEETHFSKERKGKNSSLKTGTMLYSEWKERGRVLIGDPCGRRIHSGEKGKNFQ